MDTSGSVSNLLELERLQYSLFRALSTVFSGVDTTETRLHVAVAYWRLLPTVR